MNKSEGASKVYIIPCQDYEEEHIADVLRQGIALLGGLEKFARKEQKILVKPNFVTGAEPDKAVTTHPAVIKGMLRILQEEGFSNVIFGDSPGHGTCSGAISKIGMQEEATWFGAARAEVEEEVTVSFPEGWAAKTFHFTKSAAEADVIINLCKMKTHALERITGAVKNVYGLICGMRKAAGHVRYPDAASFARMLSDIHRSRNIPIHIMDGVVAMEGNGPTGGDPVPMHVMMFSEDPVALDTVFCRMVYLDPQLVPTCVEGQKAGIGTCNPAKIRVIMAAEKDTVGNEAADGRIEMDIAGNGEADGRSSVKGAVKKDNTGDDAAVEKTVELSFDELQERFGRSSFDVDRSGNKKTVMALIGNFFERGSRRPVVQKNLCVKCGVCVEHCPVPGKAIDFRKGRNKPPVYDYSKCIRCYCCQEMCPRHAITVKGRHRR